MRLFKKSVLRTGGKRSRGCRHLAFEALEQKNLLAVFLGRVVESGTLFVDAIGTTADNPGTVPGAGEDDVFKIKTVQRGEIRITIYGADGSFAQDQFDSGQLQQEADDNNLVWGGYRVFGKAGDDVINAIQLKNQGVWIRGGPGRDQISGGAGADNIVAGPGDDIVDNIGPEDTHVKGKDGYDSLSLICNPALYSSFPFINADFEEVNGSDCNDLIDSSGNPSSVKVWGRGGNDVLTGSAQGDELYGNKGNDTLHGGGGPDELAGGPKDDILNGGEGADTLRGGSGEDELNGGEGDDSLIGGTEADTLKGDAGGDQLRGNAGDDVLEGGADIDHFYSGGPGRDTLSFAGSPNGANVDLSGNPIINDDGYGNVEDGSNLIKNIENVKGSDANTTGNTIIGDDGANVLTGGPADDAIHGEGGDDTLEGLAGDDVLSGDGGDDHLNGGEGDDELNGGDAADVLNGDAGNDQLFGGAGDDELNGGDDDDELDGGAGVDTLYGNDGEDILFGGVGAFLDILQGGAGADTLDGGDGGDILTGGSSDPERDTLITEYDTVVQKLLDFVAAAGINTTFVVPGAVGADERQDVDEELNVPGGNFVGAPGTIVSDQPLDGVLKCFPDDGDTC